MAGRPYVLAETPFRAVRTTRWDVAVLPWGATEAHNLHLPYGTDILETQAIANLAAGHAWEKGAHVVALPPVPFGVNTTQLDIPLIINLNPTTMFEVLNDVVASLEAQEIHKLVILNGHGGNDFRWMVRQLYPHSDVFIAVVDWWKVLKAEQYFDEPGDHAGEMETSVMQELHPDLVLPLERAGNGSVRVPRMRALREGWAWTPRRWTQVTADTGVGDPRRGSPEKGRRYLADLTRVIGDFLVELAAADVEELYADPEQIFTGEAKK